MKTRGKYGNGPIDANTLAAVKSGQGAAKSKTLDSVRNDLEIKDLAVKSSLIHKGYDSTFDIIDSTSNPSSTTYFCTFTVPASYILVINALAVVYSNPLVAQCQAVGWQLTINGNPPPNFRPISLDYFYHCAASIYNPQVFSPIWVQSNQILSIKVEPTADKINTFDDHLTLTARITGKMIKPATPDLIEMRL